VLDDIAAGQTEAKPYLSAFFRGEEGLEARVEESLDKVDPRKVSAIRSPKWGGYVVRVGKYGPYVEGVLGDERVTASLPDKLAPADVTEENLAELLRAGNVEDRVLGIHPEAEQPVLLRKGPYGYYVQLGDDEQAGKPKRMSLPKGVEPGEVNFQMALDLLSLPRTLGTHPETGQPVKANIGRYGPYVQHGSVYASLEDDDVLAVELDRALALLHRKEAKTKPLRVLGQHPETGEVVELWEGRYGPYVKHQRINASLPKGRPPEAITMEEAVKLLDARAASKGKGRRASRKKSAAKK
jgi:DNA topoisomerase-1